MRPRVNLRRMRTAHVVIGATALALPASAVALTGATSASGQPDGAASVQAPAKLRVNPDRIRSGDPVTVSGTASPAGAGQLVVLQSATRDAATWRQIAQTRAGQTGGFRFRVALRHSGLLRAVTPATAVAGAGGSQSTPVSVAARFAVARQDFALLGGGALKLAGKLRPGSAGRTVRLQGHGAQGWQTLASTRTGRSGAFEVRFSPGAARRLRVSFAGDSRNGRALAPAGNVTVFSPTVVSWYNDGATTGCGFHAEYGVANKTLPCGTKVTFRHGGRAVVATVDDRGPYVGGRDFDLNQNTAAALGFAGVGTVWVAS